MWERPPKAVPTINHFYLQTLMEKRNFQNANTTRVKFLFFTGQVTQEQLWETDTEPKNNTFSIKVKTLLKISLSLIHLHNIKAGLNISSWLWTSNPHVITPGLLWNWLPLDLFPAFIPLQELWEPVISLTGWQRFPSHAVLVCWSEVSWWVAVPFQLTDVNGFTPNTY